MISNIMKNKRLEAGLTLKQIADKMGVTEATVQRWESGNIKSLRQGRIVQLAEILHTSPTILMGWDEKPKKGRWIPVRGRVAAGIPSDAIEEIIDYEEITEEMANRGEYMALAVKGNSMEPRFTEGDVVIARCQPDVESGDIAIVLVNGEDATIKRLQKFEGGINLIPSNPAYPVLTYTNEQILNLPVTVLGKVVELRAKF